MNIVLVYVLLLKATLLSFSGLASLPIIRSDFVVHHKVLTDAQLNTAVAIGRAGPGPVGLYVVSVGYYVAGVPGACAGFLALVTPAFLVIPILRYIGTRARKPRVRSAIQALIFAAAGLISAAAAPLARDAVTGPGPLAIAAGSFLALAFTRIDTVWVVLASAAAGLLGTLLL